MSTNENLFYIFFHCSVIFSQSREQVGVLKVMQFLKFPWEMIGTLKWGVTVWRRLQDKIDFPMWCTGSPDSKSSDILRNAALHTAREYAWESRARIQSLKCEGNVIFWCRVPQCMIEVWEQDAEGESSSKNRDYCPIKSDGVCQKSSSKITEVAQVDV